MCCIDYIKMLWLNGVIFYVKFLLQMFLEDKKKEHLKNHNPQKLLYKNIL